ncbi:MAG: rhodanese-like domain-containing protein [Porticoccaceae bacterium]|nr:rhodanese-like domain-containing protein [Pseudomonadales bacterium]MCP5170718.1 rhodanese-like domain-containing protein [Pseudomonadales bacterium]MCP5302041.1 rhodanese-like domain-containing protein [Pseudomonadales bacterium]
MEFFTFISEQWVLVSILLVLVYVFAFTERIKSGKPLSSHELTRMLNADEAVLLDVRESKDFKEGHIVGAIHIPFNKIKENSAELNNHKNKVIVIADKLGQHAGAAGRILKQQGFQVRRLSGGMAEWKNQNLPVVKD